MRLGYNTNGLAHHDLIQAIELLAAIGYESVAITVDHGSLNPYDDRLAQQTEAVRGVLHRHGLRSVIETGARFLLDSETKHEPTLVTADPAGRQRRIDFLQRCIRLAHELGSDCVSCWSGVLRDAIPADAALDRLCQALQPVLDEAAARNVMIGFEPEPGMFIDTMKRYAQLIERIADPRLALTLDVGHLHCQGETPLADQIRRWASHTVNVHLEDMRAGRHQHLMFGEGEMDFTAVVEALHESGFTGGVHVELSGYSREGPTAARAAYRFVRPLIDAAVRRKIT